jgi:flagellar motor switch protein FliN
MIVKKMNKEPIETDDFRVNAFEEAVSRPSEREKSPATSSEELNLDVILDVPVTLSLEFGRTQISIRNLLKLNQGAIVELERLAGEPLDVLVNGTLVAHGEVVVVNEKFGIRLTDIISLSERVKRLA